MFVCNFCENSCSLSGRDNVKSVFWSASFTETRNCQHIFGITEDFFYFAIFTPRKKETRHILEVSHDRNLGVWCKGICKYDQSFRHGVISHNISRSHVSWVSGVLARAPRGSLWHCSTTIRRRCRPIQKLAKRSCLSVRDRWAGHLFVLSDVKQLRLHIRHDINVKDGLIIIFILENFICLSVQLIKIIGEKDADGFYWGECGGLSGYVPCNMVSWCW